jgi:hypothetical protein
MDDGAPVPLRADLGAARSGALPSLPSLERGEERRGDERREEKVRGWSGGRGRADGKRRPSWPGSSFLLLGPRGRHRARVSAPWERRRGRSPAWMGERRSPRRRGRGAGEEEIGAGVGLRWLGDEQGKGAAHSGWGLDFGLCWSGGVSNTSRVE